MAKAKKNQSFIAVLDAWHKTTTGYLVFALIELSLVYAFASLAIDNGSLVTYAFAIVALIGGFRNMFMFVKTGLLKK